MCRAERIASQEPKCSLTAFTTSRASPATRPANVDFYARLLGLRLVKKTVNFDAPDVYHLYYGDEPGRPGSILTFFEFPDAARGRAGAGMIHTAALAAWRRRRRWSSGLSGSRSTGVRSTRAAATARCGSATPKASAWSSRSSRRGRPAAGRRAPRHPGRARARGVRRACARTAPCAERGEPAADRGRWASRSRRRRVHDRGWPAHAPRAATTTPPPERGAAGRGQRAPHRLVRSRRGARRVARRARRRIGAGPTPIIDRQYFLSRSTSASRAACCSSSRRRARASPSTRTPSTSARQLRLPPQHEHLREQLEAALTPLVNPRAQTTQS